MKKFGIVIPTYNHAKFTVSGVEVLLPQLLKYKSEVALLISDNASTDSTEELISPIANCHSDVIEYFRHSSNVGPHANFYFGVKHIDAEYVCLLGDDDIVSPNYIEVVLSLLNDNKDVGMIHFNYLCGLSDLKKVSVYHNTVFDTNLICKYQDGKSFIYSLLIGPSFMSSNVFLKESMLLGMNDNYHEDCFGYDWLACLYYGVLDKPCIYYELPMIVQRFGNMYQRYALNTILGQHRLFEYAINDPDLVHRWEIAVNRQEPINMISVISSIPQFRDFYKIWYKEMSVCLISNIQHILLFISVYFPRWISVPILSLSNLINKIYLLWNRKK